MNKLFSALHQQAAGFFILRCAVAASLLLHGVSKLLHGTASIEGLVVSAGLPAFVAYGVLIGEVVAPLLVLANRFVVPAALVMAFNMVVAVALVHTSQIFTLGKSGGWALELQGLYFFGSLAIALLAPRKTWI
jgi:putative oxidoreductase